MLTVVTGCILFVGSVTFYCAGNSDMWGGAEPALSTTLVDMVRYQYITQLVVDYNAVYMLHTYTSPVSDATVDHGKPSLARSAAYNGRRCGDITSEHGPRSASHQATGRLSLIINEGCFCKTPVMQTALPTGCTCPYNYQTNSTVRDALTCWAQSLLKH
jgi:hypothetical protein